MVERNGCRNIEENEKDPEDYKAVSSMCKMKQLVSQERRSPVGAGSWKVRDGRR